MEKVLLHRVFPGGLSLSSENGTSREARHQPLEDKPHDQDQHDDRLRDAQRPKADTWREARDWGMSEELCRREKQKGQGGEKGAI